MSLGFCVLVRGRFRVAGLEGRRRVGFQACIGRELSGRMGRSARRSLRFGAKRESTSQGQQQGQGIRGLHNGFERFRRWMHRGITPLGQPVRMPGLRPRHTLAGSSDKRESRRGGSFFLRAGRGRETRQLAKAARNPSLALRALMGWVGHDAGLLNGPGMARGVVAALWGWGDGL